MKDFIKDFLLLLSTLGSILLVCLTILGVAANWYPRFSMFAQMHLHSLLCALFAFFIFLLFRRKFGLCLASLLIILNAYPIALATSHTAPIHKISTTQASKPVKLMWANLWIRNLEIKKIMAEVKRVNPDIVVFSELVEIHAALGGLLKKDYPYQAPFTKDGRPNYLFIASKHPIKTTKWQPSTRTSDHPPMLTTQVLIEGKPLTLVATHLYWPFNGPRKKRAMMWLSHYINTLNGPVFIAGDFNLAPFAPAMRFFEETAHVKRFGLFERSWPTSIVQAIPMEQVLIDHIFKRDGKTTALHKLSYYTGNDIGSDHLPIVSTFQLVEK